MGKLGKPRESATDTAVTDKVIRQANIGEEDSASRMESHGLSPAEMYQTRVDQVSEEQDEKGWLVTTTNIHSTSALGSFEVTDGGWLVLTIGKTVIRLNPLVVEELRTMPALDWVGDA